MSQVCQVTGKKPSFGKQISHSHRVTGKVRKPNLHQQRFWVTTEKRWVKLRVSAAGIKEINKRGIEAVLKDLRKNGLRI